LNGEGPINSLFSRDHSRLFAMRLTRHDCAADESGPFPHMSPDAFDDRVLGSSIFHIGRTCGGGISFPTSAPVANRWGRFGLQADAEQPSTVSRVGEPRVEAAMSTDQDFLLYPLGTEEQPECPGCGKPMTIALHEARSDRPDFSTFRCQGCTRSERFVFEN
jgi:hypothetical protein